MDELHFGAAHERELLDTIEKAGGSEIMREMVKERSLDCRHSILEEYAKWHDGDMEEAVETAQRLGGGFFQKVWDGELAEAFLHADGNNKQIMREAFDKVRIIRDADSDYLAGVVDERY